MAYSEITTIEPPSEEWRTVPGWNDVFSVSACGQVRRNLPGASNRAVVGKILTPERVTDGYLRFTLSQHKHRQKIFGHRLVMLAFVGPIPKGHQVNHLNGHRDDNRLSNLEYCTQTENMRHAIRVLKSYRPRGQCSGMAKLTTANVLNIYRRAHEGETHPSIAREYGVSAATISAIKTRRNWKHLHQ